jgi:hypothetical protein
MADRDFVVKNGLVVNSNTTVNGFIANSTQFTLSTINSTSNGIFANSTLIAFGNSSINVAVNTSTISIGGNVVANSTGANNSFNLGGTAASSYALKTDLSGYLTSIPSSYVQNTDSRVLSGNLNFTGTNTYFSGKTTFNANLVINTGLDIIDSTGARGTVGQVLTSNGGGNVYWSTVTTGGPGPGYVQNTDTRVLSGNLNFTGTNTYFSGKTTFNANIVINSGINILDSTGAIGTVGQVLTSNGAGNVYWSTVTTGGPGPSYVQNTDTRVLSGNLNFTGTNVYFTAATFSPAGIYFGANSLANVVINSSTVFVGNSTVNSISNSTITQLSNSSTTANLTSGSLVVGTSVVNTTVIATGANVVANTTALNINASTTNTTISASSILIGNTVANLSLSTTSLVQSTNVTNITHDLISNNSSSGGLGPIIRLYRNSQTASIPTNSGSLLFNTQNNSINYTGSIQFNGQGSDPAEMRYYSNGAHRFYSNNGFNILTITNTYFVGVNNTSPTDALSVNGSIRSVGLKAYEITTPTNVTTSTGSGSLSSGVYYIRVVAVDSIGGVTEPSVEVSRTVGSSGSLRVQFDAVPGAVKYRIYYNVGSSISPPDPYTYYSYFESTTNDYTITTTTGASSSILQTYNSTGSVNIGAYANTNYKLTLQNNANGGGQFVVYNSNTGSGTIAGFDIYHGASPSTSYFYHNNDGKLFIKGGSGISFQTGSYTGTERMTLTNGNLAVTYSVTAGTLSINQVGPAIIGYCQTQNSIFGQSYGGTGVVGQSNTGTGIIGQSNTWYGVYGYSNTNYGVYGLSNTNNGVVGQSTSAYGVYGQSNTGYAGYFTSNNGPGVFGYSNGNYYGVYGISALTVGVVGYSDPWAGVWGSSNSSFGGYFTSKSGAPLYVGNNTNEFVRVAANGNVGIGSILPASPLTITPSIFNSGTVNVNKVRLFDDGANNVYGIGISGGQLDVISSGLISFHNICQTSNIAYSLANMSAKAYTGSGSNVFAGSILLVNGEIRATDNITAYYSSDISLKENIMTITTPLQKVDSIRGVTFDWTDDYIEQQGGEDGYFVRKQDVGVIAQEIEAVLPEAVATRENGIKAVKYERIVPLLIEAIKELKAEIDELKGNK